MNAPTNERGAEPGRASRSSASNRWQRPSPLRSGADRSSIQGKGRAGASRVAHQLEAATPKVKRETRPRRDGFGHGGHAVSRSAAVELSVPGRASRSHAPSQSRKGFGASSPQLGSTCATSRTRELRDQLAGPLGVVTRSRTRERERPLLHARARPRTAVPPGVAAGEGRPETHGSPPGSTRDRSRRQHAYARIGVRTRELGAHPVHRAD